MKTTFNIAGRKIDQDFPPLLIAEIAINHEGSLEVVKEMVDAAQRAGAANIDTQADFDYAEFIVRKYLKL